MSNRSLFWIPISTSLKQAILAIFVLECCDQDWCSKKKYWSSIFLHSCRINKSDIPPKQNFQGEMQFRIVCHKGCVALSIENCLVVSESTLDFFGEFRKRMNTRNCTIVLPKPYENSNTFFFFFDWQIYFHNNWIIRQLIATWFLYELTSCPLVMAWHFQPLFFPTSSNILRL